jgi:hypothetical protein
VQRFYADAINGRDLSAVDRLLTEDFVHNGEFTSTACCVSRAGGLPRPGTRSTCSASAVS